MSVMEVTDDLTTDSVPEPPRDDVHAKQPKENAHLNGDSEDHMKEKKEEKKKKKGTKDKSSKTSKTSKPTPEKPQFNLPHTSANSTTININAANHVHLGHKYEFNITHSSNTSAEKKEKHIEKPKAVSELMKKCDIVTEDDLDIVASHIGRGWKTVGRKLGFSNGQLEQIEENSKRDCSDFKEMIYQMLLDWKQYEDNKATVGILCQALWKTHQYEAAANLAKQRSSTK